MNTSNSSLKFYELRRKGFLEGSFRRLTFVLELVIYLVDLTVAPECAAGSFLSLSPFLVSVSPIYFCKNLSSLPCLKSTGEKQGLLDISPLFSQSAIDLSYYHIFE